MEGGKKRKNNYAVIKILLLGYKDIKVANLTTRKGEMVSFYAYEKDKFSMKIYWEFTVYISGFLCLLPKNIPTNQIKKTCDYQIVFHLTTCHIFSNVLVISCHM